MKRLLVIAMVAVIASVSAVGCSAQKEKTASSQVETEIKSLDFATLKSPLDLKVGQTKSGHFRVNVKSLGDFSIDEIEFYSSDPNVATFEYDKTSLENYVYYIITGISSGESTVYAKVKGTDIKTDDIKVSVSEESESSASSSSLGGNKTYFTEGRDYKLINGEDESIPKAVRKTVNATITGEQLSSYTDEELKFLLKSIVEKTTLGSELNALSVFLYVDSDTNGKDKGDAYPVAICNYYPYGDISKAPEVKAGDYDVFEYKYTITRDERNQIASKSNE